MEARGKGSSLAHAVATRRKTVLELQSRLKRVSEVSQLDDDGLIEYLRKLQDETVSKLRRTFDVEKACRETVPTKNTQEDIEAQRSPSEY